MKKILQLLNAGIILIFLFSSCSIEKRRYMPGYNIEWNSSKPVIKRNEFVQNNKPGGGDEIPLPSQPAADNFFVSGNVTASAVNSTISTKHISEKSKDHANALTGECDIIILKNGDEIKAKVSEISQDEIKYRKCEEIGGLVYTLKKSEVFMIKYPNGTKDIFTPDNSSETKNGSTGKEQKTDSGAFGIISLASMVAALIIFIIYVGHGAAVIIALSSLILVPLAIVCGIIGIRKGRKLKGLAIAGLSLGFGAVLFSLIALIILLSFFTIH